MASALLRLNFWPIAAAGLWIMTMPAAPAVAAACTIPTEAFAFEPMLPRTVAALSSGKPVNVVAIGSASTEGRAAGGPEFAWPQQFGLSLSHKYPAAKVSIINLAKPRQTAADMTARFDKEILPHAPVLVVWQTGTVDTVRGVDVTDFRSTLQAGIERLRSVSEVIIMDAQFSRSTSAMMDFGPYETAMREVSDAADVPLFPRYDLMRYWSETGEIDFSVTDKDARREVAKRLYSCIGRALEVFVTRRPGEKGSRP